MKSKEDIIKYLNDLEEVKRLKELMPFFEKNKEYQDKMSKLTDLKKHIVNAREFNQINQYKQYKKEYDELEKSLSDIPFYDEYVELLEYINNLLESFSSKIGTKLDTFVNT